jgi:hypothetical protein
MARKREVKPPRPPHVPGRNVHLSLKTYNPKTKKHKHRWFLRLPGWTVEEVREIILEAFNARQPKGGTHGTTTQRTQGTEESPV